MTIRRISMRCVLFFCLLLLLTSCMAPSYLAAETGNEVAPGSAAGATDPKSAGTAPATGTILGTVLDTNGDPVSGAIVELRDVTTNQSRKITSNESGFYEFRDLAAGSYQLNIRAKNFADWNTAVPLDPGQVKIVTGSQLRLAQVHADIEVLGSQDAVALAEVKQEEHQLIFGIIPNFFVVYDKNPAPLTSRLKFRLAWRVVTNPVTWAGVGVLSAFDQAADSPNYRQGWKGYAQRYGANGADGVSNIMLGGYVLPSLLHQDPRYFYQGLEYSKWHRAWYAVKHPFICPGDNGKMQLNVSSMGGDVLSAALSNAYYPDKNRGAKLVYTNFALNTAERILSALLQEFVLPKLTPWPTGTSGTLRA